MQAFARKLKADLDKELNKIDIESNNAISKAESSYYAITKAINQLRDFTVNYQFQSIQEEIHFYKTIKPSFQSEQLYQAELYHIEANMPIGNRQVLEQYYQRVQEKMHLYFNRNTELFVYLMTGKTLFDEQYFLRANDQHSIDTAEIDPGFSTHYSYKVSKLMAYQQVINYLNNIMAGDQQLSFIGLKESKKLIWTGNKIWLIELVYALHAAGVVNNGQAEIGEIVALVEQLFNIKLGNFYSTFLKNIRPRKKTVTLFLNMLTDFLMKRINHLDEHPHYS